MHAGGFKHHSYFQKEKYLQSRLYPNVCLDCRKSFKKPQNAAQRRCPQCGGLLIALSRKFAAPKVSDIGQWEKIRLLVTKGFVFQTIYEDPEDGSRQRARYPKTLAEAKDFVLRYRAQAVPRAGH